MSLNHFTSQSIPNPWANPRLQTLQVDGASSLHATDFNNSALTNVASINGGGVPPSTSSPNTFTATQSITPVNLLSVGNLVAVDGALSNIFLLTLTENTALVNPSNLVAGTFYSIVVTQGASAYTIAYDTDYLFAGGSVPTISTGAGDVDVLTFLYDGNSLLGVISQNFS